MAKLFIEKADIASRITWFYVLMSKSPIEIYGYDEDNEDLEFENPMKVVPCLMDGDVNIWGSQACILYIAEKYGKIEEFGKTQEDRSKTESLLSWATTSLLRVVTRDFVEPKLFEDEGMNRENRRILIEFGKKSVHEHLDVIESRYLKENTFILGKEAHFMDFYIGMILSALDKVDFDFSKWPQTSKWYHMMQDKAQSMIDGFQEG